VYSFLEVHLMKPTQFGIPLEPYNNDIDWSEAISATRRGIPPHTVIKAYAAVVVSLLLWCALSVVHQFWGQWLFFLFPVLLCVMVAILTAGTQTAYFLQVRRVPISLVPSGESPKGMISIALVSDLHLGRLKGREWLTHLVQVVNRENPDLILLAGDFVYKADPERLGHTLWPIKDLQARRGVYAVFGNHDYGVPHGDDHSSLLARLLPQYGVDVLNNEAVRLEEGLYLLGLDDLWTERSNWTKATADLPLEGPLEGNGSFEANRRHPPLWLCGHTHGGQVIPPWLRRISHLFDRGLYQERGGKVFVTQGAGEVGASLRLTSQSEVALLEVTI
jgi:predicted MPP superfamily phosphohydrolase